MTSSVIRRFGGALLTLVLTTGVGQALADKNWRQNGNSQATTEQACVRPTDQMRRNHMELLKHQRDITVHQGIRDTDTALHGCVSCHANYDEASGNPIPVTAEGQFCAGCHGFVGVKLDCFGCHSKVPQGKSAKQAAQLLDKAGRIGAVDGRSKQGEQL